MLKDGAPLGRRVSAPNLAEEGTKRALVCVKNKLEVQTAREQILRLASVARTRVWIGEI